MNQKHCNAKTSTLNGSALSTKCRKYEKVIGRPNVISLQHTVRDSWAQRTRSESTERRRDPFIKRKRGEPQEQVTETQSEGKTRFYPTHSHEFRGQTGKGNPIGEGMAPGNKNWLRMPNRPTERGKSLLLQKEMNQKHCNAKTSTLNGSALSTKCRKYEKVIGRPNVISLQHTVRDSWAQRTRSESTERRRDPFIKRKRGEPQEQVTETQSEGKTRFYPTHTQETCPR